jgi:hypothetical protein
LARPYLEAERARIDAEVRERVSAIEKRENELRLKDANLGHFEHSLRARANEIDNLIEDRLSTERAVIAAQEVDKAKRQYDAEVLHLRQQLEQQSTRVSELQQAELEYRAKSAELENAKRELELEIARRLSREREQIRVQAIEEQKQYYELEKSANNELMTKLRQELEQARNAELAVRRERQALADEKQALELEVARQLDGERCRIREDTQREDDERYRLRLAEKDAVIEQTRLQLDEARRKADQGSQQIQGEVLEHGIRKMLEEEFRDDEFEEVPRGQPGGDVIQRVKLPNGIYCGAIIWESKNTKNWSDSWLIKIRQDQRASNAELCVILSVSLPRSIDGFDYTGRVWVTDRRHALALAKALRHDLINNRRIRVANEDRNSKADVLFEYVTGNTCYQRISIIVDAYMAMQNDLEAEKRAIQRQWAKRARQLDNLLTGTAQLYGDLQGIVGKSMPELRSLSLPAPDQSGGNGLQH